MINIEKINAILRTIETPEDIERVLEEDCEKCFGKAFAAVLGFQQKNPHHMYTLDRHLLYTVLHVNAFLREYFEKNKEEYRYAKELRIAALYHDIGKPEVASESPKAGFCISKEKMNLFMEMCGLKDETLKRFYNRETKQVEVIAVDSEGNGRRVKRSFEKQILEEDKKNRPQVYYNHAEASAEKMDLLLQQSNLSQEEKDVIVFLIRWHDAFINVYTEVKPGEKYKVLLTKENMENIFHSCTKDLSEQIDRREIWRGVLMIAKADVSAQAKDVVGWEYHGPIGWRFGENKSMSREKKLEKCTRIEKIFIDSW